MKESNGKIIAPKRIATHLSSINSELELGVQQDSHEFIRSCVDKIHTILLADHASTSKPSSSSSTSSPASEKHSTTAPNARKYPPRVEATTAMHQIFGGYMQSQVKCAKCGHESNVFDPFLDISLDIVCLLLN